MASGVPDKFINRFLNSFTVSDSALRISTYAEDYRVRGYQYIHLNRDVFPNGSSYFVLDPSALVAANTYIFTVPISIDVPEGPIIFTVYENTDYEGTVDLVYYNPERSVSHTALATIRGAATGTTKGTKLYEFSAGATSIPAVINTSGASEATDPTTLDRTKSYLVEVNNTTGASITANKVYFSWFEVPETEL